MMKLDINTIQRPELGSNPFVTSALTATTDMHIDYWGNTNFNSFSLLSLFVASLQLNKLYFNYQYINLIFFFAQLCESGIDSIFVVIKN
jgi:hypothetical protein